MSESQLLANILLDLSRDNTRLFRFNSGSAWQGRIVERTAQRLVLSPYYAIKLGAEGMSDIGGLVSEVVTPEMVGRTVAISSWIEAKSITGRISPQQRAFIRMILERGGRAGVARSVEEAERILHPPNVA